MTRDLLDCKGVRASFTESRRKRVADRVYHAVLRELQTRPQLVMKMIEGGLTRYGLPAMTREYILRLASNDLLTSIA